MSSESSKFQLKVDRQHYAKCSEIKIHFYLDNISYQDEDEILSIMMEKIKKAVLIHINDQGQCEFIFICEKNLIAKTIKLGVGMRYDHDAKLIYIGKKHINHGTGRLQPILSDIFRILLQSTGELDKDILEERLKQSRIKFESVSPKRPTISAPVIQRPLIQAPQIQPKELIQVFLYPSRICQNGQFKKDTIGDQIFEYLEIQEEEKFKNGIKIKGVPCLVVKKKPELSWGDLLKNFQLVVKTVAPIELILKKFKHYGQIVGLFQHANKDIYYILYASENAIKQLNPPGQFEIQGSQCQFELPESNLLSFPRPAEKDTLHDQMKSKKRVSRSRSSSSRRYKKKNYQRK
ncbi:hypothetical protein pb186bvf_020004 [Paramecium bursaria]